jgi:hypothetical protein
MKKPVTKCVQDDVQRTGNDLSANRQPVDRRRLVEFIAAAKERLRQRTVEQRHETHRTQHMP